MLESITSGLKVIPRIGCGKMLMRSNRCGGLKGHWHGISSFNYLVGLVEKWLANWQCQGRGYNANLTVRSSSLCPRWARLPRKKVAMNSSSGSSTVTMSTANHSLSNSEYLSSSQSSLGPSKKASSEISKGYKQASQLFLTRRLSEALAILQPVIARPVQTNGNTTGEHDAVLLAPIAMAAQTQRVKIWSLYVTLMNAIVDLGNDEGKRSFGQKEYKALVAKVRDGEIWEQVVRDGYGGREGSVDAEVVYNLYVWSFLA